LLRIYSAARKFGISYIIYSFINSTSNIFPNLLPSSLSLPLDPFAVKEDVRDSTKVHIRVQQRSGRKSITTVQGLAGDLDLKKIARVLKKTFHCDGTVNIDEEHGEILQLSGDQRTNIREFLIDQQICHEDQIVIHGG
jgi:translation initiation factor 1